jgi:hypothetical protein
MREHFLFAIIGISIVNGIFSPYVLYVAPFVKVWIAGILPLTPSILFYVTSLVLSGLTLIISGVPAAVYERLRGVQETDQTTYIIWTVVAVFLTLPAIQRIFGA